MYLEVVVRANESYLKVVKVFKAEAIVELIPMNPSQGVRLVKGFFPTLHKEVKWYRP